jgi:hypothetical protein
MPDVLNEMEIETTQAEARALISDERSRSGIRVDPIPDPATSQSVITDRDLATMRDKFPFLREFSDGFLRASKPENLIKMEAPPENQGAGETEGRRGQAGSKQDSPRQQAFYRKRGSGRQVVDPPPRSFFARSRLLGSQTLAGSQEVYRFVRLGSAGEL